jgi:Zn2+/Cd2+-exporting ATPase
MSEVKHVHSDCCGHDHEHEHVEMKEEHAHEHGGCCGHDHAHEHTHEVKVEIGKKVVVAEVHEHEHEHGGCCGGHDHAHAEVKHEEHKHDHGTCGHDHGHDHSHDHGSCGHDHGHDHSHDHGSCGHDHGHDHLHDHGSCGHDHGHDHLHDHGSCGHDHGHDHHHHHGHGGCGHDHGPKKKRELRALTNLCSQNKGDACQLELDLVLEGETDHLGRFEQLERLLEGRAGIIDVHVSKHDGVAQLCVHYDCDVVTLQQLMAIARADGNVIAKRYRHKTWFVRGLDSPQCADIIEHSLNRMNGILQADVAYAAERLVVEYDQDHAKSGEIESRVKALGYELEVPEEGHVCPHHHGGALAQKLQMPLVITAGVMIALGLLAKYVAHIATAPEVLFTLALFCAGTFPVRGAVASLKQGQCDIEVLTVLAAFGAGVIGAPFEGAFLLFLFSLGHALEHNAIDKARRAIEALGNLRPETARVKRGNDLVEVPVSEVVRGDIVVVRPGDRVPLDGEIVSGQSSLDQATITGESVPVAKSVGDQVFASTINTEAALEISVTKLSSESMLSRIINMVAEAEAQKSPTQRRAKKLERTMVPIVLLAAPSLFCYLFFIDHLAFKDALLRAISLLVAASPCALAIAAPSAVLSAVGRAARNGVLIKGGAHLETLGRVSSIAFDKTGTLTIGKPRLMTVTALPDVTDHRLLSTAASAESHSSHPLATAIVDGAKERKIEFVLSKSSQAVHGKGLHSEVNGEKVAVGSLALFEGETIPDSVGQLTASLESNGQTSIVVRAENSYLGVLGVADQLRPEAKDVIASLKRIGIKRSVMLSGDNNVVARAIGSQVGIDEVRAPLLPDGKVEELKKLSRDGGVAMIGDGVNDAPALAAASVGIAMGGTGSDVALETADLVLMNDGLSKLPFAVKLSRAATDTIMQNLYIALGVSALLVTASIFGWVQISQAVILHEGSTIVVLLNGLRLLRFQE